MSTTTITGPGQAVRTFLAGDEARIDGDIKVRGEAIYTADMSREGMLWAAFAESPYPHAKIVAIDKTAALAVPGVVAILTGADIGERRFGNLINDWPVLAFGETTFIGEYVAVVGAETREAALEAAAVLDVSVRGAAAATRFAGGHQARCTAHARERRVVQLCRPAASADAAPQHAGVGDARQGRSRRGVRESRSRLPERIVSTTRDVIMPAISSRARRWCGSTATACATSC